MEIRTATLSDREEIVSLYQLSQAATLLPDPAVFPPETLGEHLYSRDAIERFVAIEAGRIVGHALIEEPNPTHIQAWQLAIGNTHSALIEMGGAFVDPELACRGIWSRLLDHRMQIIVRRWAIPVSATWSQNMHVKKVFRSRGGVEAGEEATPAGMVSLFAFPGALIRY